LNVDGKKKERAMKKMCAVLIMVLLFWASGCSTAPERLSAGMENSYSANLRGFVKAPIGKGSVDGGPTVSLVQRGFAVLGFRAKRDEYGRIFVVGEVKNVGAATQGVELQVTLRDSGEHVLAVGNFCPAANHSIAPNDTRVFAYSFGRQDKGAQAELRIIRTFYTMDTLGIAALTR
jgi:hypothetical protein